MSTPKNPLADSVFNELSRTLNLCECEYPAAHCWSFACVLHVFAVKYPNL